MSLNNFKGDYSVVFNATLTDEQRTALEALGLRNNTGGTGYQSGGTTLVVYTGGMQAFEEDATVEYAEQGITLEKIFDGIPREEVIFNTVDELIAALS